MKINHVYEGDCIDKMATFDENSIAACITDPPYNYEFIGHKWDDKEVKRRLKKASGRNSKTLVKHVPYGSGLAGGVRNSQWYKKNRDNIIEYREWCLKWAHELYRICKAGAPVAVFNSSRTAAHVQIALEDAGFYTRDVLVYKRNSGIPKGLNVQKKLQKTNVEESRKWEGFHSCFRNEYESIVLVQKPLLNNYITTLSETGVGVFKTINKDGSFQSNILDGFHQKTKDEKYDHCTVKPKKLIKKLIDTLVPKSPSNIILDPFAGSGTTLVAAIDLGYNYIGIEIEAEYVNIIRERVGNEMKKSLSLFN